MERRNRSKGFKVWQRGIEVIILLYVLFYGLRIFEYFVLHTDRTWVGEAVFHKLAGIAILLSVAGTLGYSMADIGFAGKKVLSGLLKGLGLGMGVYACAYSAEILMTLSQERFEGLRIYVSAYAIDQNIGQRTEILFFAICVIGNLVNVVMEEGVFRGLFVKMLEKKYSFIGAAVFSSVLFGFWHVIGPVRNYMEGTTGPAGAAANAVMLLCTSALVGFKFAMLTELTGNLYTAMGDHFVNNTIVNLLHVVSESGADEWMVVRVSIAQSLSFAVVLALYIGWRRKKQKGSCCIPA
ncbi:MAG: CPBP family intramembrane metalloprotease [Lachnospiraceae bacterium]|nr:CPBP family intramembrane metalloprotease [Lachnospiraceae bacterium]